MNLADRVPADPTDPDALHTAFAGWAADQGLTLYPAQEEALVELVTDSHVILATPTGSGKSLVAIPTKVGALVHAIGGGERDPETPISVVGASIIGGDTVDHGLWVAFWFFLAQLNFVLGAINLVPLLPFDGGHIAIAVFEKIRNMIRSVRRVDAAPPVNYLKLMPATYVILVVVVGYMLLTVTADLVNPIRLFQ